LKKTLITILIITLLISISAFGFACKKKAPADEEVGKSLKAAEEEPIEEVNTVEAPVVEAAPSANYSIKFDAT